MSEGSQYRKVNAKKYASNWTRIYGIATSDLSQCCHAVVYIHTDHRTKEKLDVYTCSECASECEISYREDLED